MIGFAFKLSTIWANWIKEYLDISSDYWSVHSQFLRGTIVQLFPLKLISRSIPAMIFVVFPHFKTLEYFRWNRSKKKNVSFSLFLWFNFCKFNQWIMNPFVAILNKRKIESSRQEKKSKKEKGAKKKSHPSTYEAALEYFCYGYQQGGN